VGGQSDRKEAASSRFAHVFFDLDGTLIDSREGIVGSIQYALHALGQPRRDPSWLERFIGPPLDGTFRQLLGTNDGERVRQAIAAYRVRFGASGIFENRVYDGIPEALRALGESGRSLFVVTSKPAVYARTIVDHHGLRRHFRGVYGAELDGERADKGILIRYVLGTEWLSPQEVVMVGDRAHDVVGARENGVASLAVRWGYASGDELESVGPDAIVDSVSELTAWLSGPGGCPGTARMVG
jgi:phosphoglycolate phosphatase